MGPYGTMHGLHFHCRDRLAAADNAQPTVTKAGLDEGRSQCDVVKPDGAAVNQAHESGWDKGNGMVAASYVEFQRCCHQPKEDTQRRHHLDKEQPRAGANGQWPDKRAGDQLP